VLIGIEFIVMVVVLETEMLAGIDAFDVAGFITVVGNGILFIGLMAYKRIGYGTLFHPAKHSVLATMALVSAPILLMVPGLVLLAGWANSFVVWLVPMSEEDVALFDAEMSLGGVSIFFACVAAPVLEEMLFRGVMLRAFLQRYSRTFSILWSAALFGIAHLNVYQLATAIALGIFSGWLYERCRSLWPCILLHAAYNSFVTYDYYVWVAGEVQDDTGGLSTVSTGVAVAAAVVGALALARLLARATPPSPEA